MNASLVYLLITSNEATRQIWKALRCRELKSDRRSSQAFYKASLRISSNLNINIQKNYMQMFILFILKHSHSFTSGLAFSNQHILRLGNWTFESAWICNKEYSLYMKPFLSTSRNHFCSDRHSVSRPRMLGFRAYSSTSIQENTIKVPSKQWDQGTNENTLFSFEVCRLSSALLVEAKRAVWGNYWKDRKNCKSCPAFLSGFANHFVSFPKGNFPIFVCFAECLLCHNVAQRSCFPLGRLTLCNYCRGNLVSPSWILAQFHFLSENKRRISVHLFCIDTHIQTYTLRYIVHAQKTLGGVHD